MNVYSASVKEKTRKISSFLLFPLYISSIHLNAP